MTAKLSTQRQTLYERDYNLWLEKTVRQLRKRDLKHLDWDNLVEEIEYLAKSDKRELKSRLTVLLEHLLKLAYWEQERPFSGRGWRNTVKEQRLQIEAILEDSPSLRRHFIESFEKCYLDARFKAADENLPRDTFPMDCPFTLDQILTRDYWPEQES